MKSQFKFKLKKWQKKYFKQSFFVILLITPLAFIYNSCEGDLNSSLLFSRGLSRLGSQFKVLINEGDFYTNNSNVKLTLTLPPKDKDRGDFKYEIKISNNANCKGGKWELYTPEKDWDLLVKSNQREADYSISAQFREERKTGVNYVLQSEDSEAESKCFSDTIFFDNLPPRFPKFNFKPPFQTNEENINFQISAIDPSPLSYQCKLLKKAPETSLTTPCPNDLNSFEEKEEAEWKECHSSFSYENLSEACYALAIKATDAMENTSSTKTHYWEINRTVPTIYFTPPYSNNITNQKGETTFTFTKSRESIITKCRVNNSSNTSTTFIDCNHDSFVFISSEGSNTFEVIGIDEFGNEASPLTYTWTVDTKRPTLSFTNPPPLYSISQQTTFNIRATDNHGIRKVSYKIYEEGQGTPLEDPTEVTHCHQGRNCRIEVDNPPLRIALNSNIVSKTFDIVFFAEDTAGNQSEHYPQPKHSWKITRLIRTEEAIENIETSSLLDILFLVDDSFSMEVHQETLSTGFNNFISEITHFNWRIAFTTTDPIHRRRNEVVSNSVGSRFISLGPDGLLVPLQQRESSGALSVLPDKYYITPSDSNAQEIFQSTIQSIGTRGSPVETGIRNSYRAIQRYHECQTSSSKSHADYGCDDISKSKPNKDFFRETAGLAIILISDEDEHSNGQITTDKSQYKKLQDYIQFVFGLNKKLIFNSIVTLGSIQIDTPSSIRNCTSDMIQRPNRTPAYVGCNYMKFSQSTNGNIIDINKSSYTDDLESLSDDLSKRTLKTLTLNCIPPEIEGIEIPAISIAYTPPPSGHTKVNCITPSGNPSSPMFQQEKANLIFDSELCPGSYTITHSCYENPLPLPAIEISRNIASTEPPGFQWQINRGVTPTIAFHQSSLPSPTIYSAQPITIRFTKSENLRTFCQLNNNPKVPCDSSKTITPSPGENTFKVTGIDEFGSEISTSLHRWSVIIDEEAPHLFWDPVPLQLTSTQQTVFNIRATDNNGIRRISYKIYEHRQTNPLRSDSITNCNHGHCSININNLPIHEGTFKTFNIVVSADDNAGNNKKLQHTWTVDKKDPLLIFDPMPPLLTSTAEATFNITTTDSHGIQRVSYKIYEHGQTTPFFGPIEVRNCSGGSCSPRIVLSPRPAIGTSKTYKIVFSARDVAGNLKDLLHTWTVDQIPPTLIFDGQHPPPLEVTSTNQNIFYIKATDTNGIRRISYKIYEDSQSTPLIGLTPITNCNQERCSLDTTNLFIGPRLGASKTYRIVFSTEDMIGNLKELPHSWTIDRIRPSLAFTSNPPVSTIATQTVFNIRATDTSGIRRVSYEMYRNNVKIVNSTDVICSQTGQREKRCSLPIDHPRLNVDQRFKIVFSAEDIAGNRSLPPLSALEHTWTVARNLTSKSTIISIENSPAKVDILFVVDDSGSMKPYQTRLSTGFNNFISSISNLDWKIAFTTTSNHVTTRGNSQGPHGLFVQLRNSTSIIPDSFYITSLNSNAQNIFKYTIQSIGTAGSGREVGIQTTFQAIKRYYQCQTTPSWANQNGYGCDDILKSKPNKDFFREDASLAVILISDEDENSNGESLTSENQYMNLSTRIKSTFFDQNKKFVFNSIVTVGNINTGNPSSIQNCVSAEIHSIGYKYPGYVGCNYIKLSQLTGGDIVNIQSSNYITGLRNFSRNIHQRTAKTLTLECTPQSSVPISVHYTRLPHTRTNCYPTQSRTIPSSMFFQENENLKLTSELCPGDYRVDYSCLAP